jgi:hypothetical protein
MADGSWLMDIPDDGSMERVEDFATSGRLAGENVRHFQWREA